MGTRQSDREIAAERIERLLSLARDAATCGDDERAKTYVRRARRIAERHRLPRSREFTRSTCDECDRYLLPGSTARVRLQDGHVVVTCDCGAQHRYPYE